MALALGLTPQAFQLLLPDDGHHREWGRRIGPPPAERCVEAHTEQRDYGETGAERGLIASASSATLPRAHATWRLARAGTGMTSTERLRITRAPQAAFGCSR
jgi:hypothetical protein